jgi:amino acid transporter
MVAAIGWQRAVDVRVLAAITENGDGGPIAAVARVYLPPSLSWIALAVVVTSAVAGLQVSMTAGARTAYRMAQDGHLPRIFGRTNRHQAPWVSVVTIGLTAIAFIWRKPLAEINFYYDTAVVTLAFAYFAALAAFCGLVFRRLPAGRAALACALPCLAMGVLGYLMYSAGAAPADPKDLYQAWYIGAGVLGSSALIVLFGRSGARTPAGRDAPAVRA